MSINNAQAEALAEGFLNTLGSEENDFKPVETVTRALAIAGEMADLMASNVPVHNGKLAASITVEQPETTGRGISVSITMLPYGQFIEKGVRGTKGGTGLFAFKNDMPSRKMVEAIKEYLRTAKLAVVNIKRHPISKHELKNQRLGDMENAFAVARSIKQHGIKPVAFIEKASQVIQSKYDIVLADALVKDIYNSLPNTI